MAESAVLPVLPSPREVAHGKEHSITKRWQERLKSLRLTTFLHGMGPQKQERQAMECGKGRDVPPAGPQAVLAWLRP